MGAWDFGPFDNDDALEAIRRIRIKSEMKEPWDEHPEANQWYATLDDLTFRLKATPE